VSDAPVLEVHELEVHYGRVQVLFGVDLEVQRGELVALLGTNGAGKSTLLKAVTGLLPARAGEIRFHGESIAGRPTNELAERGIVMMPGGRSVFPTLTVRENLAIAGWMLRKDPDGLARAEARVRELFPRLTERLGTRAGELSGGVQQMLAVAQALIPDPELLLVDELSLGLAPTIVGMLCDVLREANAGGLTIVVVEQSVNVALQLAERAVFLEKGAVQFTGPTADLLERPDVLRSVFLADASEQLGADGKGAGKRRVLRAQPAAAPVVLACHGVHKRFGGIVAVSDVDLEVRKGEIVGLVGQNGAGKTTLLDCISGFLPVEEGRILLGDQDLTALSAPERAAAGLGRSFQEARLFPALTTMETIAVARERHLMNRSLVADALGQPVAAESEAQVAETVDELIELLGLGAFRGKLVGELSTGSRRIVELACLLAADPELLVLDEPSGGVAQRETEALGPLLRRVREHSDSSILIIEHDMPLLRGLCDRLYALELGAVIASGTPEEVLAHPDVVRSYLGMDAVVIERSGAPAAPTRRTRRRSAAAV
jgi:branched-chain amino acid transport system ATP-binding protein